MIAATPITTLANWARARRLARRSRATTRGACSSRIPAASGVIELGREGPPSSATLIKFHHHVSLLKTCGSCELDTCRDMGQSGREKRSCRRAVQNASAP